MNSIFNITEADLAQVFNFVSKVCAAELDEISVPETDKIIRHSKGTSTEIMWDMIRKSCADISLNDIKKYDRCYTLITSGNNYPGNTNLNPLIKFRIYVSDYWVPDPVEDGAFCISYMKPRFTTDEDILISVVIPKMQNFDTSDTEVLSQNDMIFFTISDIFLAFLQSVITSHMDSYTEFIPDLADVFAIITGLFPDDYNPLYVDSAIVSIAIEMLNDDSEFISTGFDGSMQIKNKPGILLEYLYRIFTLNNNNK